MDIEYNKGILFVRLNGNLYRKDTYKINNYIIPVIQKHHIKYLVYNLKNLQDIKLSGIDAIINSKCEIKKNKGKILFCNINKNIEKKIKSLRCKIINEELDALKMIGA